MTGSILPYRGISPTIAEDAFIGMRAVVLDRAVVARHRVNHIESLMTYRETVEKAFRDPALRPARREVHGRHGDA